MRFISKKQEQKALVSLIGLARAVHTNNLEFWSRDPEVYAFCIEALAELAYTVGGISGIMAVKDLGFEFDMKDGDTNG